MALEVKVGHEISDFRSEIRLSEVGTLILSVDSRSDCDLPRNFTEHRCASDSSLNPSDKRSDLTLNVHKLSFFEFQSFYLLNCPAPTEPN